MTRDIEYIVYSEEEIKRRVNELAGQITVDYAGKTPLMIGVLKGSFCFFADLVRAVDIECEIRFISASSYGTKSESTGEINIEYKIDFDVTNRDIIIIEDILDSGTTLTAMREFFSSLPISSLKTCVLLDKPARRKIPCTPDYTGFDCPDKFIVGYGLDFAERYRNLPYIAALKHEIYS